MINLFILIQLLELTKSCNCSSFQRTCVLVVKQPYGRLTCCQSAHLMQTFGLVPVTVSSL